MKETSSLEAELGAVVGGLDGGRGTVCQKRLADQDDGRKYVIALEVVREEVIRHVQRHGVPTQETS